MQVSAVLQAISDKLRIKVLQNRALFIEMAGMSKNNFTTVTIKNLILWRLSDEIDLKKSVRG